MRSRRVNVPRLITVIVCSVLMCVCCLTPISDIAISELFTREKAGMYELEVEEIYAGKKPYGCGSVQGFAITNDNFVIACRPPGSAENGGETNNRLIAIDRETLQDVSSSYKNLNETYELGHANGLTYDSKRDEIKVVGINGLVGERMYAARIDASNFKYLGRKILPTAGSSIAYSTDDKYYIRYNGEEMRLDGDLREVEASYDADLGLTAQDIGYNNDAIYMVDWVSYWRVNEGRDYGLKLNQNVINKLDVETGETIQFAVKKPRMEMESIDFIDGEAYILYNGSEQGFYIYKVSHDENFDAFMNN